MTHPLLSHHKTRCSIPYSHDRTILPSPPQQVLLLMDLLCRLLLLFRNFRFVTKGKAVLDNSINALALIAVLDYFLFAVSVLLTLLASLLGLFVDARWIFIHLRVEEFNLFQNSSVIANTPNHKQLLIEEEERDIFM